MRPVLRSRAIVKSLSFSTAVTKILSPAMDGDEWPGGSGVFQTTLVSGPNFSGRFASSLTPAALGPRNWGQSAAIAGAKALVTMTSNAPNTLLSPLECELTTLTVLTFAGHLELIARSCSFEKNLGIPTGSAERDLVACDFAFLEWNFALGPCHCPRQLI